MTVWIIDDNAEMSNAWEEVIIDANPAAIVKKFSSFREAVVSRMSFPDIAIVDMTAVCGSQFSSCLDHLSPFLDRHPGCHWVIASAFGRLAKQYFDEYEGSAVIAVIDTKDTEFVAKLVSIAG